MRVAVYFNLHTSFWSVRNVATGRVIGHASRVLLREAGFKVSEAGRRRVIESGVKNVHAFVVGDLEAADWVNERDPNACRFSNWRLCLRSNAAYVAAARRLGRPVTYNPFKAATFTMRDTGEAAESCPMVSMHADGRMVLAFDPCGMTEAESARTTQ
jgi:hypothetical protein